MLKPSAPVSPHVSTVNLAGLSTTPPLSPGPNALMPLVRSGAMLTSKGDLGTSAPAKVTMTMCRPTLTGV